LGNELKWGDRLVRIDSPNYLSVADVKNGTTRTNGYTEFILTPDKLNWIMGKVYRADDEFQKNLALLFADCIPLVEDGPHK